MQTAIFVATLYLVAGFLAGCSPGSSDIRVQDIWARPAHIIPSDAGNSEQAQANSSSAVYMAIHNQGRAADTLIEASSDAAERVEIHQTIVENDVARMSPVESIEIPAGETVTLQPGGYHIMLRELRRSLVAGETISLVLKFESGKEVTVEAMIQETFTGSD